MRKPSLQMLCSIACCALATLLFASCATRVSTRVTRPSELDMRGANSIAILPFQDMDMSSSSFSFFEFMSSVIRSDNEDRSRMARHITEELQQRLVSSKYLKLVDSSAVRAAIENHQAIPVDVYLTGYISYFESSIKTREEEKQIDGVVYRTYSYAREVSATVVYEVVDARTNSIIEYRSERISDISSYGSKLFLPSAYSLLENELDSIARKIVRQVQPYEETVSLSLMKGDTKNPDMELADEYARSGELEMARDVYYSVYQYNGSFAAGYNTAMLMQIMGDLEQARDLLQKLYDETGSTKARKALINVNKEISSAQKLQSQLDAAAEQRSDSGKEK